MSTHEPPIAASPSAIFLRSSWLLAGNAAIYVALNAIATLETPLPSYLDYVVVAGVFFGSSTRAIDIQYFDGQTMTGERATLRHWLRHTTALILLTTSGWLLAHFFVGNFS